MESRMLTTAMLTQLNELRRRQVFGRALILIEYRNDKRCGPVQPPCFVVLLLAGLVLAAVLAAALAVSCRRLKIEN